MSLLQADPAQSETDEEPTRAASEPPEAASGRDPSGFWAVTFAFLIVMAFATLPSPLYGLYVIRDDLSTLTVTVVYAIFAAGTIATLLSVRYIVPRVGRRGVMLGAVAALMVAAGLLAASKALPALLIGRLITGVAVGLAAGTAITYMIELRLRENPNASPIRARNIGTAVNVGALGVGPLIAGCLAAWVTSPLTVPYVLFVALGAIALVGVANAPETGSSVPATSALPQSMASSRSARLLVPAAITNVAAFAANGLFAGLSGLFLATTLDYPSLALAGATLFLVFSSGVAAQLATDELPASRIFALGALSMLAGLALLVTTVRLSTPSLALFLAAGALIGAGAGTVFKGTTGLLLEATPPEGRLAVTSDLLISAFVGLSIPVIGAGIALDRGASAPDAVLGFAVFVGLGVVGAGAFLGRSLRGAQGTATP
jgi:hypothetical protein